MGRHSHAPSRPLVVTADDQFLDQMLTLAAASGGDLHVAPDTSSAHKQWSQASVVVIDEDVVSNDGPWTLERRANVVLVGRDADGADIWQRALRIGAEHVVFMPDANDVAHRKAWYDGAR